MAQILIIPTKDRDPDDQKRRSIHVAPDIVLERIGNSVTWSICCPHAEEVQDVVIEFENNKNHYFTSEKPPHICRRSVDRKTGRVLIRGRVPLALDSDQPDLPEEDKYTVRVFYSNGKPWAQKDPKIVKDKP